MVTVGPRQGQGALVGSGPPILPFIAWSTNPCGARLRLLQMQLRVFTQLRAKARLPPQQTIRRLLQFLLLQVHVVRHVQRLLLPLQHLLLQAHVAVRHVRIMMAMAPKWSSSTPVSRTMCPTQRLLLRRPVLPGRLSKSLHIRGLVILVRLMVTTRVCLAREMRTMTHLLLLPLR